MAKKNEIQETARMDVLFERISDLIEQARQRVMKSVNIAEVYTKFEIGRYIVYDEQQGENRAQYGKKVLKDLSARLTERFGDGWSVESLKLCRRFFMVYSNSVNSVYPIQGENDKQCLPNSDSANNANANAEVSSPHFSISWSHYLILMRVENPDARSFYEIECAQQQWSVRQLSRQVGSSLYERLALSRNKDEVMRLAREGQTIEKPSDIIKDPMTLEFLGLKPDEAYSETKLEKAIISKLQTFLLELGKGFLFEKRQKRFTFDEENYYVDLVFYNRQRQELLDDGIIAYNDKHQLVFIQNHTFYTQIKGSTALSSVASLILHGNRNGWEYWYTEDGKQLGQVEGLKK